MENTKIRKSIDNKLCYVYICIVFGILLFIFIQLLLSNKIKWIHFLIAITGIGGSIFFSKFRIKYFPIMLFVGMLIVRVVAVWCITTPPISDFEILFNSAEELLAGNNDMLSSWYYTAYPYQTSVVLYFATVLGIYDSIISIKVMNCLFSAGTVVVIYFIVKELVSEESARVVSLCYGFFPFPLFYNTILTNQIPSAFFFYTGLYIFVRGKKEKRVKLIVASGILIAIGNLFRPEGIIFLATIIGYYLLSLKKDNIKKNFYEMIMVCIIYCVVFQLASCGVKLGKLNEYGLENNNTYMKFVLGLNIESNGTWDEEDMVYLGDQEKQKEVIAERIKKFNICNSLSFFADKMKEIFGGGDTVVDL